LNGDWSRKKVKKRKVAVDEREEKDPYYAMMKTEKEIVSRFENHFDIDDEDHHAYYDKIEQSIGRYPVGFRHYENYENYKTIKPEATISDYQIDSKQFY